MSILLVSSVEKLVMVPLEIAPFGMMTFRLSGVFSTVLNIWTELTVPASPWA